MKTMRIPFLLVIYMTPGFVVGLIITTTTTTTTTATTVITTSTEEVSPTSDELSTTDGVSFTAEDISTTDGVSFTAEDIFTTDGVSFTAEDISTTDGVPFTAEDISTTDDSFTVTEDISTTDDSFTVTEDISTTDDSFTVTEDISTTDDFFTATNDIFTTEGIYRTSNDPSVTSDNDTHCERMADIFILLDSSGSVGDDNYKTQLEFASRITEYFTLGPQDTRIGAFIYSDEIQALFGLDEHTSNDNMSEAIKSAPYLSGSTATHLAFESIKTNQSFSTSQGGRDKAADIIIILTDGKSDSQTSTLDAADDLKRAGVTIIAIGIANADQDELEQMASSSQDVFYSADFNALTQILNGVAQRTCQLGSIITTTTPEPTTTELREDHRTDDISTTPLDISTTDKTYTGYDDISMSTHEIFTTSANVSHCDRMADIIILLDSSGSVTIDNYMTQLDFASKITEYFTIGPHDTRIGAIIFSDVVDVLFGLDDYSDNTKISQAIKSARYIDDSTKTHLALELVYSQRMFSKSQGGRPEAADVLIIMTDGISDDPFDTKTAANTLKQSGVTIIAIGIANAEKDELDGMASSPQDVFNSTDFNALAQILEGVSQRTCGLGSIITTTTPVVTTTTIPTTDGSSTTTRDISTTTDAIFTTDDDILTTPVADLQSNISQCLRMADILIVIDSSASVDREEYEMELNFASNITQYFKIGPQDNRIGSLIFDDDVHVLIGLDWYTSSDSVSQLIKAAPKYSGTTATHLALQTVTNNSMFSPSQGGREEAPDVLIILTDGQSDDSSATLAAANTLKAAGVTIIAIGIDRASNYELEGMASSLGDVFNSSDFNALTQILESVSRRTCQLGSVVTTTAPTVTTTVPTVTTKTQFVTTAATSMTEGSTTTPYTTETSYEISPTKLNLTIYDNSTPRDNISSTTNAVPPDSDSPLHVNTTVYLDTITPPSDIKTLSSDTNTPPPINTPISPDTNTLPHVKTASSVTNKPPPLKTPTSPNTNTPPLNYPTTPSANETILPATTTMPVTVTADSATIHHTKPPHSTPAPSHDDVVSTDSAAHSVPSQSFVSQDKSTEFQTYISTGQTRPYTRSGSTSTVQNNYSQFPSTSLETQELTTTILQSTLPALLGKVKTYDTTTPSLQHKPTEETAQDIRPYETDGTKAPPIYPKDDQSPAETDGVQNSDQSGRMATPTRYNPGIITVAVFGGALFSLLLIIVVLLLDKRNKNKKNKVQPSSGFLTSSDGVLISKPPPATINLGVFSSTSQHESSS